MPVELRPSHPRVGRRAAIRRMVAAASLGVAVLAPRVRAQAAAEVRVSVPGPGNSVSDPVELAVKLGIDRAAGIALRPRYVSGGGIVLKDLDTDNTDFGVFGLPAAMLANAQGASTVALAAIDDLPLYTLMVRADLRDRIRRVADLAGRTLGVHSNSLSTRTTSTQLAELVLRSAGVAPEQVRVVAAGQSWDTQSAVMASRAVDASMCDEPIGARLAAAGLATVLFSTGRPDDARSVPGAGFLRATLIARRDRVDAQPELAARMVDCCLRTLRWMAENPAEKMADVLGRTGDERDAFLLVHREYRRMYSRDGRFSTAQLRQTEVFLRAGNPDIAVAQRFEVESMVIDRWVGRKP